MTPARAPAPAERSGCYENGRRKHGLAIYMIAQRVNSRLSRNHHFSPFAFAGVAAAAGARAGGWRPTWSEEGPPELLLSGGMVQLAAAAGDAAATRVARRAHRWYFPAGAEGNLKACQPSMGWQQAGGVWSLPWGDFLSVVLEFGTMPVGGGPD